MARDGTEIPSTGLVEYNGVHIHAHKLRRRKAERECEARKARNMTAESSTATSASVTSPLLEQPPIDRDFSETPSTEEHTAVLTELTNIDVIAKNVWVSGLLTVMMPDRLSQEYRRSAFSPGRPSGSTTSCGFAAIPCSHLFLWTAGLKS